MYDDTNTTEEPVEFADFNAKLLVLDVLCYDLDVLEPYDGDDAGETDDDLDVDGQDDRAREYYDDLDVLPSHLALVTQLTVDSDLEVLQDVHPGWDGRTTATTCRTGTTCSTCRPSRSCTPRHRCPRT